MRGHSAVRCLLFCVFRNPGFLVVAALTRWDLDLSSVPLVVLPVRIQPCVAVQPVLSN